MRKLRWGMVAGVMLTVGLARAEDADISAAQSKLEDAKSTLKSASGNFGGHRENAVQHIDRALAELKQAQQVDTRKDAKTEHKVQKLEKKDEKLQNQIQNLKQKSD